MVRDRDTGRSRGFGFVRYRDKAHAEFAIKAVNNTEYVVHSHARSKSDGADLMAEQFV